MHICLQNLDSSPVAMTAAAVLTAMSGQVPKKKVVEPVVGGGALQMNGPSSGDGFSKVSSGIEAEEKTQRARAAGKTRASGR